MAASESLAAEGVAVAVVSLPCWELFSQQDDAYRARAGRRTACRIEAAGGFGWERWLGNDGVFIGMTDFGPRRRTRISTSIRYHAGRRRGRRPQAARLKS